MIEQISDIGNVRKQNEDSYGIIKEKDYNFFLICDGMGGANAGDVASHLAKEAIIEVVSANLLQEKPEITLKKAFYSANEIIFKNAQENDNQRGMGTTVTCALSYNQSLYVAHVGDSALFQIRNGTITKQTKDHTYVQELLDLGKIDENEAKHHPKKHVITRAVGTSQTVKVDQFTLLAEEDDIYLLCTDGLTDYLNDDEILDQINHFENQKEALESLATIAKERGGSDNITLLIFGGEALK